MPEYTVCLARQDGDWVEVAERRTGPILSRVTSYLGGNDY